MTKLDFHHFQVRHFNSVFDQSWCHCIVGATPATRSNCLQTRRIYHQVKYQRLNANTCIVAAILFSGHPYIGSTLLHNQAMIGHQVMRFHWRLPSNLHCSCELWCALLVMHHHCTISSRNLCSNTSNVTFLYFIILENAVTLWLPY